MVPSQFTHVYPALLCACATALLSFVAPELLGAAAVFRRVYSDPISKSRDREATRAEKELGEARARYTPCTNTRSMHRLGESCS